MKWWIATAPVAPGPWGTGPVDLSVATQALLGPAGYDMPGGSGPVLDGAYRWFLGAANSASDPRVRAGHILDAVRALNNLAVWALTRWDHPEAAREALEALQEAERLMTPVAGNEDDLRGGVYFNLGQLAEAAGQHRSSTRYLDLAQAYGFRVHEFINGAPGAPRDHDSEVADGLEGIQLGAEPAPAMTNGKTQLMFWAAIGEEDNVRSLIQSGVDINAVDDDGDTALYYAVSNASQGVVELLLKHGANPNICGSNGVPLRLAAGRGWTQIVRTLISSGARVDARSTVATTQGVTALMVAAGAGHVECVQILLMQGADPGAVDADGDSALFYARSNGQNSTSELLRTQ